jgi:hypothetical protein
VFPKPFDIFNLCLYGSMIPLSALAHGWLATYMGLLTTAANAVFMWVSAPGQTVQAGHAAHAVCTLSSTHPLHRTQLDTSGGTNPCRYASAAAAAT